MDVRQALVDLARHWWLALLIAVLVLAGGLVATWSAGPRYTATAESLVAISQPAKRTTYILTSGSLYVTARMSSFAALGQSDDVLQAAAQASGGTRTVSELRDEIEVSAVVETSLLQIEVTDPDPQIAAAVANATASAVGSSVEDLEHQQLTVTLATPATAPVDQTLRHYFRNGAVALVGGLVLGAAVAMVVGAGRRARRREG